VPASWVEQATRSQVSTAGEAPWSDWEQGYGFQFWMSRHGYRGDGAYGQFCVVLPEHDAVLALTAETPDMQAVLEAAWQHLLPAFDDAVPGGTSAGTSRGASADDGALADRLARLELPVVAAAPSPAPETADRWRGFRGRTALGDLTLTVAITAPPAQDGAGWRLALGTHGTAAPTFDAPLGTGWTVGEAPAPDGIPVPVGTSGGWTGPEGLRFDVAFLETPHRLEIRCSLPDRIVATWRTAPLMNRTELRAPRY
jgi:hypothetical protein